MKKLLSMGIILLLVCVSIPSTGRVIEQLITVSYNGSILYVGGDGPGNYTYIQDAINVSLDGDTIYVYNNIYYEHLHINKDINVFGEDKEQTIIDAQGIGRAVEIGGYVNFSGFTIRNAEIGILNFYPPPPDNIYIFFVFGNIITNNIVGIALSGTFTSVIHDNIITNNQLGITFFNADNYEVENNNFIDNERHAYFEYVFYLQFLPRIKWNGNYWDDWNFRLPRLIKGEKVICFVMRPGWVIKQTICKWYNVDWHPAKKPFDIVG